jgi:hypothetical protein
LSYSWNITHIWWTLKKSKLATQKPFQKFCELSRNQPWKYQSLNFIGCKKTLPNPCWKHKEITAQE